MEDGDAHQISGGVDEWGSAVADGDAVKLSEMVLEWSGSKPEAALSLLKRCVALVEEDLAHCAADPASPSPKLLQDPAHSSCLGAFGVALSQTCDGKEWYASTRELQLASLQFCAACRGATTLTLRVDRDIPRRLLAAADAPPPNRKKLCRTRVPRLRARRVVWDLPTAAELRTSVYAVAEAREMHFSRKFVESLEGVVWPRCLRILEVHSGALSSDLSMAGVVWPGSLQRLTFGGRFNQPMEEVVFPASLVEVSFGFYFNRSIERISWPAGLRRLKFLFDFNQPIRAVTWPDSMTQLTLGSTFNRPIHGVKWPASLLQLTFGYYFDKPIEGVVWPATLQRLTFGRHFDRPIEGAAWPDSLRQLTFGEGFDQPIGLVRWPASLEDLHIGTLSGFFMRVPGVRMLSDFNHPIGGARWPASLRRLTLGGDFLCSCQRLKSWMPNLEHLTLLPQDRSAYPSLLGGVEWPDNLRSVTVFADGNFEGVVFPTEAAVVHRTWGL